MSSENRPVRFGILGTGWMADIFARELNAFEDTVIAGVASTNEERARAFAARHGILRCFGSYTPLTEMADLDVVYIATTHERHFENAMQCLHNGKAVLVEKPITVTIEEAETLIAAARSRQLFCMEAMWMRCFPFFCDLERRLLPIGRVDEVEASFCIDIPYDPEHRLYAPRLGGGALLDIGIYPLSVVHRLWGFEAAEVTCRLTRAATGTDDAGIICFQYPDGRSARLDYSLRGSRPHRALFKGAHGAVTVDDFFHPSRITTATPAGTAVETPIYPVMGYHFEIEEVVRCFRQRALESPRVPLETSLAVLRMMRRILELPTEEDLE